MAGRGTITETILQLSASGAAPADIGRTIGRSTGYVTAIIWNARQKAAAGGLFQVLIPYPTHDLLAPIAQNRGISTSELVRRLLDVIARENLVDSVLDDQDPTGA